MYESLRMINYLEFKSSYLSKEGVNLTTLPYDLHGEVIKCLNKEDILNLRKVCKETKKNISRYGTVLVTVISLEELKEITEKNNNDKLFKKIVFELNILNINLGVENVEALVEELKVNKNLQILTIINGHMSSEGGKAIAEALKVNQSLKELQISGYYNIDNEGGKAIAEALKVNKNLQKLDIGYNNTCDEGGKAIAEALKVNKNLKMLYIRCNNIGEEVKEMLRSITQQKKGFKLYL